MAWPRGTVFARKRAPATPCSSPNSLRSRTTLPATSISFRFVQLPFNLAMTEALTLGNQSIGGRDKTVMEAASELDITLVASASLLQGQVARNLPAFVAEALGLEDDAQRSLQFVRSSPGITTALVGMSHVEHVRENAKLVGGGAGYRRSIQQTLHSRRRRVVASLLVAQPFLAVPRLTGEIWMTRAPVTLMPACRSPNRCFSRSVAGRACRRRNDPRPGPPRNDSRRATKRQATRLSGRRRARHSHHAQIASAWRKFPDR